MKKAQGLPINFIVIAALAILILILAAGFVIAGGSSIGGALGPQQAKTVCNNWCNELQTTAGNEEYPATPAAYYNLTKFCGERTQDVQGVGTALTCPALGVQCTVTFNDGSSLRSDTFC